MHCPETTRNPNEMGIAFSSPRAAQSDKQQHQSDTHRRVGGGGPACQATHRETLFLGRLGRCCLPLLCCRSEGMNTRRMGTSRDSGRCSWYAQSGVLSHIHSLSGLPVFVPSQRIQSQSSRDSNEILVLSLSPRIRSPPYRIYHPHYRRTTNTNTIIQPPPCDRGDTPRVPYLLGNTLPLGAYLGGLLLLLLLLQLCHPPSSIKWPLSVR